MQQHVNHSAPDTAARSPMQLALESAETFTRAQVADLMGQAFEDGDRRAAWAYRAGHHDGRAELGELMLSALAHPTVHQPFSESELRRAGYQATARREADIAAGHPWHGDYPGGGVPASYETGPDGEPVPGWPATAPDYAPPPVSTRVRRVGRSIVWADA